tara:strand:+ start:2213 stop:2575 length:363 start_codon:yes stop_codon:yes gene_type:complete
MKKIALILASVFTSAGAAVAGPYVNVESNASYTGSDYQSRTTDFHVGWEGGNDTFDYYVQGGPALVNTDGAADGDTQVSGKVGASVAATDKLGFYGEVSVITAEDVDNSWGTKIGTKYSF